MLKRSRPLKTVLCQACCVAAFLFAGGSPRVHTQARGTSIDGIWDLNTLTPLERPKEFLDRATFTRAEAAEYERTFFERGPVNVPDADRALQVDFNDSFVVPPKVFDLRTSLIVDPPSGKLPEQLPQAKARNDGRPKRSFDNPENLNLVERCLTMTTLASPPLLPVAVYDAFLQIVSTPETVLLSSAWIHDVRVVRINGRHLAPTLKEWLGDSIGHWDGTTLVVDTTNFREDTHNQGSSERLHVVERFTPRDATTLDYRVTVDDPETWSQPWTAAWSFHATDARVIEVACHEGNHDTENFLRGARFEERTNAGAQPR